MGREARLNRRPEWTEFDECKVEPARYGKPELAPAVMYKNSRYTVAVWYGTADGLGDYAHLSIKTNERTADHDWRDYQRIKNELVGPEFEGVELYPAESRLVDNANQFHIWVFRTFKFPFGFKERLVSSGNYGGSAQRPFEAKPADCLDRAGYEAVERQAFGQAWVTARQE